MANKRMFSLSVVDSDAFLDMPLSTQALYFHLNMRADDDGFIGNPKRIQRLVGASDDDLKLLIAKRFVLVFEDGVIVVKHWRMHNTIQKDRYTPTNYQDELSQLHLKDNKAYTLDLQKGKAIVSKMETVCKQDGNILETNRKQIVSTDIDIDKDKELDKELEIEESKNKSKRKEKEPYFPEDPELNEAFEGYVSNRKAMKAPMTDRAIRLAMGDLEKLAKNDEFGVMDRNKAIEILNQSVMNGWKGLFPLKNARSRPQTKGEELQQTIEEMRNW